MTQRVYWVPHTVCPFGCLHCHNDSAPGGPKSTRSLIDRIIERLPAQDSRYRLEDVLIGGGEGLAHGANTEYLLQAFRERYPKGAQATAEERRAAGHVILAIQTAGPPLAGSDGTLDLEKIDRWLDLGVDYFQVASSDRFHRSRHPTYPWDALEDNMRSYSAASGVEFRIYGKEVTRLVPSGRVLRNPESLEAMGASLLTEEGYCADGWETGSRFLSGLDLSYPECSEVVIDPRGWVHPCCWYLLSPGLFDLAQVSFEVGMERLQDQPLCGAIDRGDVLAMAELAGIPEERATRMRALVGDCGLCRLASLGLGRRQGFDWIKASPLIDEEEAFYAGLLEGSWWSDELTAELATGDDDAR